MLTYKNYKTKVLSMFLFSTFSSANSMQLARTNIIRRLTRNYSLRDLMEKEKEAHKQVNNFKRLKKIACLLKQNPKLDEYLTNLRLTKKNESLKDILLNKK